MEITWKSTETEHSNELAKGMGPTSVQASGPVANLTTSQNFHQRFCIHIMAMTEEYIFMI